MENIKKSMLILSLLVVLYLSIPLGVSQNQKIGFNADLEPLSPTINDNIFIRVEIVNPTNYLIKTPPLTLRYEIIYDGPGSRLAESWGSEPNKISVPKEISAEELTIRGGESYKSQSFFIDEYNKRKSEDRIGEWTINLELTSFTSSINEIQYFDDNKWKGTNSLELEKVTNPIKFTIEKPEIKAPPETTLEYVKESGILQWLKENIIVGVIVGVLIAVIVAVILKKLGIK